MKMLKHLSKAYCDSVIKIKVILLTIIALLFISCNKDTQVVNSRYEYGKSASKKISRFVAIAQDSAQAAYSGDGIKWSSTTMPYEAAWIEVCYGNGRFVAVARDKDKGAYSDDGINWKEATMPNTADWRNICYGGD
jgi:hypothetical protein